MTIGMRRLPALPLIVLVLACAPPSARAEVLIRWDQDSIPPPQALEISTVVIPASRPAAIRAALARGYRVQVEIAAADAGSYEPVEGTAGVIVRGGASPDQTSRLLRAIAGRGTVRIAEDRGKWPHIRTNWVTRNKDVLQVTNRSAQPWLENNGALARIAANRASDGGRVLLTYTWQPVTVADLDQGPRLDNYLVAIAEAGSFGADILLPLHERFEQALLTGAPDPRAEWAEIRSFMRFYAWDVARPRHLLANIAVVTDEPMGAFEVLNLLVRHNLPFVVLPPAQVTADGLAGVDLVLVLDAVEGEAKQRIQEFGATNQGRVVQLANAPADPNAFALEMRQRLGRERRVVDIWNGITVLVVPYAPTQGGVVLSVVNYAAQPLPVQLRVRGAFSAVQYEAPGEPARLLPFEVKDNGTEFVLPALRVGGRVFLNRAP